MLIQCILACRAKIVLFMTFWTNIEPYHMFYIIVYVTLKITEQVFIQLLLEFYHIHFIMILKPNNFDQTNTIVLLFLKS